MNRLDQYKQNLGKRLEKSLIKQAKLLKKLSKVTLQIKLIDEKITRVKADGLQSVRADM